MYLPAASSSSIPRIEAQSGSCHQSRPPVRRAPRSSILSLRNTADDAGSGHLSGSQSGVSPNSLNACPRPLVNRRTHPRSPDAPRPARSLLFPHWVPVPDAVYDVVRRRDTEPHSGRYLGHDNDAQAVSRLERIGAPLARLPLLSHISGWERRSLSVDNLRDDAESHKEDLPQQPVFFPELRETVAFPFRTRISSMSFMATMSLAESGQRVPEVTSLRAWSEMHGCPLVPRVLRMASGCPAARSPYSP